LTAEEKKGRKKENMVRIAVGSPNYTAYTVYHGFKRATLKDTPF
jgi:hypothetical protein